MSVQTWLHDVVETAKGNERSRRRPVRSDGGRDEQEHAASGETAGVPSDPVELYMETGLTPEEYVQRVLRRHDGRLKQSEFVAETGWSESTVSRRLCSLEEDGAIERILIGREKHVCLPEIVPDRASD